jgi:hypothetical protein
VVKYPHYGISSNGILPIFVLKKHVKKQYIFLFLIFLSLNLSAQVAGISASKLATYDAVVIPKYTLEVEPSFTYLYSRHWFNVDSHSVPYTLSQDSSLLMKDFFMRFTYGVGKGLEMGAFINGNLGCYSFGAKWRLLQNTKSGLVMLLGTNFSDQSNKVYRNSGFYGKTLSLAGGFAYTRNFNPRLSWDVDIQAQHTLLAGATLSNNYFLDTEMGYYVFDHRLQLAGGFSFNYNHHFDDNMTTYRLTLNPGVTIETGKSYILVLYFPVDVIGKSVENAYGFSLAFTLAFE